jgi:hypothetical protein
LASKVYLVLGNYCTSPLASVSSSGDFSADYPAAGAIDGDRTELNVGPAAGAENSIGQSSWRSDLVPDQQTPGNVYLIVNFGASRTINKLRVYFLTDHALKTYTVQYWDGAAWQDITLQDLGYDTLGYGLDAYGTSPYGSPPSAGQAIWGLSNIFASDVTTTKIKIIITETEVLHDYANIVEVEAYRLLDITERVPVWKSNRNRDFKLKQDMASTVELTCDNTDKFFSEDYVPTAAQVAAGFVNSELRSQLGVIVQGGFEWSGSQVELLPQFTGFVDKIDTASKARTATIQARDQMKALLSTTVTTRLKTGLPMELAIAYLLNLCNISSYDFEIDLNKSKLTIPYFFVTNCYVKDVIDEIVAASGDAQFYFDESGIAIYKQYTTSIPNNLVFYQKTSGIVGQPGWDGYTSIDNISLDRQQNQVTMSWVELSGWVDGNYTSNPAWTPLGPAKLSIASQKLTVSSDGTFWTYSEPFIYLPLAASVGQWQSYVHYKNPSGSAVVYVSMRWTDGTPAFGNAIQSPAPNYGSIIGNGYEVRMSGVGGCNITLIRFDGNVATVLATSASIGGGNPDILDWLKVIRKADGTFKIYWGGVLMISYTDNTYPALDSFALGMEVAGGGVAEIWGSSGHEVYYSQEYQDIASADDHTAATPTWISSIIDLGTDVVSLGILEATIYAQAGCTPTIYTRTSANGSSWDAYVQVNPNAAIGSTARRYIQVKMVYSAMTYNLGVLPTPSLNDMVINWVRSGGVTKYPVDPSRTLAYDGSLIDVVKSNTDTLGGDNSIINDCLVVGTPYNLSGNDSDVAWEYMTGIPAAVLSATNQLFVNVGTVTIQANIPNGMDTSRMAGASPAALNIVWGTAVGTAVMKSFSPVNPVIELTITTAGTVSAIQLIGKVFSTAVRNFAAETKDTASIKIFGLKSDNSVTNPWILNQGIAQIIADSRIANYKDETKILYNLQATLQPSAQMGDRVTVTDLNTAISADYWIIGINHERSRNSAMSVFILWKIPAGL